MLRWTRCACCAATLYVLHWLQIAKVRSVISGMQSEFAEDTIPCDELRVCACPPACMPARLHASVQHGCAMRLLQVRLEEEGLSVPAAQLTKFIKFCSDNYDKPQYMGKLPPVLFMEENNTFVVCT